MADKRTPIQITQGAPIVNEGYIIEMSDNLAAIELDMKSKNCEVWFMLSPCGICVHETEHSLRLDDEKKGLPTEIYFHAAIERDNYFFRVEDQNGLVFMIPENRVISIERV